MAKNIDYVSSKEEGEEWGCIEAPEPLKFWSLNHGWQEDCFKKFNLKISTVSVSSSRLVGEASTKRHSRKSPLILKNGFEITEGSSGLTSQNQVASYPNIHIDSIKEFNDVMKLLSEKDEMEIWKVTGFQFWNEKLRAKIRFKIFSPNSQAPRNLYLDRIWDESGERPYANISYYDQQTYCNYFSNIMAACVKRMVPQVDCKIKILEEMGRLPK